MKLDTRSVWIVHGSPGFVKKFTRAPIIFFADIFRTVIASGNLGEAHIMVNVYLRPALVRGRGPTQSTITLLNGSFTADIG